jgi:hypothetical protein
LEEEITVITPLPKSNRFQGKASLAAWTTVEFLTVKTLIDFIEHGSARFF